MDGVSGTVGSFSSCFDIAMCSLIICTFDFLLWLSEVETGTSASEGAPKFAYI